MLFSTDGAFGDLSFSCGTSNSHLKSSVLTLLNNQETRQLSVGDSSAYTRHGVNLDDVVIVAAVRTPMTKAKRGGLKDTTADDLVGTVLKAVIQKTGLDPAEVGDVVFGSVLSASQRATEVRIGAFFAGFPETVPVQTVNR